MSKIFMRPGALLIPIALLAGCETALLDPSADALHRGDATLGRAVFAAECAICHASGDAFDLAFFAFADTTIIRRAVAHVDTAAARDIVAHVRALGVQPVARDLRLFQPGGRVAASDVAFATELFGADAWPRSLTSAALAAIDPREVAVSVVMPEWSNELENLDWMPDRPVPAPLLDSAGGLARTALAAYRAMPTAPNLTRAVTALRRADRARGDPDAPCLFDDPARVNYETCFQVRRWTSSLVALHFMRYGTPSVVEAPLHDVWWDVGNAARKSGEERRDGGAIDNRVQNWAAWMYLGWSFDPSRHPSVYTGGGLRNLGLDRHATFVALRSQVARRAGTHDPYLDAHQAIRFAPAAWTHDVAIFGFTHLLERLDAGDSPDRGEATTRAADGVRMAVTDAFRKLPLDSRPAIRALADRILAALGES